MLHVGALPPITGALAISTGGLAGVCHDTNALGTSILIFANGLGKGDAFGSFEDEVSNEERVSVGRPAFRNANFVPNLENMFLRNVGKMFLGN